MSIDYDKYPTWEEYVQSDDYRRHVDAIQAALDADQARRDSIRQATTQGANLVTALEADREMREAIVAKFKSDMGEAVTRPDAGRVIIHRVGKGGVWLTTFFPGIAVWIRSAGFYRGRRITIGGDARSEQAGAADSPSESGGDTGNLDALDDANTDRNPDIDAHEHPDTDRNLDRLGDVDPDADCQCDSDDGGDPSDVDGESLEPDRDRDVVDPDRYAVGYKHAQTTDRDPNTQTDPNAG